MTKQQIENAMVKFNKVPYASFLQYCESEGLDKKQILYTIQLSLMLELSTTTKDSSCVYFVWAIVFFLGCGLLPQLLLYFCITIFMLLCVTAVIKLVLNVGIDSKQQKIKEKIKRASRWSLD